MSRSSFFQSPTVRVFAVAVAAGAALSSILGMAGDAPPTGARQIAYTAMVTPTSTTLTASPASTITQGTLLTLTATVTPATAAGTVQFRRGTTDIGTPGGLTGGTASVTTATTALAVGTHQLTAVFTPTDSATYDASMSLPVSLTVTGPEPAQTTTLPPQLSGLSLDPAPVDLDLVPGAVTRPAGPLGIPAVMIEAYQRAEQTMADTQPGCHLSYTLLAAIGRIESGHASDGRVDAAGNTLTPIRGQRLNGSQNVTTISDTDQGALDGDLAWDRAVGPMQFIPSTWRRYGAGNPDNIHDSTLAAGRYLCAGGTDLSDPAQQQAAVLRYNHSAPYAATVLRWAAAYQTGVVPTLSAPGILPPAGTGAGGLLRTAARVTRAPVVANLDAPAVTDLDAATPQSLD
ncbi:MAG: lytic transglycosylase domain-containing protein [Pseudonocardiaceae bacterium]